MCEVDLPWGGREVINPGRFTRVDYQRLALRGGRISIHNWLLSAGYRTEVVPSTNSSFGHGGQISAGYSLGNLLIDLQASFTWAPIDYTRFTGSEYRLGLRPSVNIVMGMSRYNFRLGLGLAIQPTWQHLIDRDAERLKAAGMEYEENHQSLGLGPQLIAGFSTAIFSFTALLVEITYTPLWIHGIEGDDAELGIHHSLGLGVGISRAF